MKTLKHKTTGVTIKISDDLDPKTFKSFSEVKPTRATPRKKQ